MKNVQHVLPNGIVREAVWQIDWYNRQNNNKINAISQNL